MDISNGTFEDSYITELYIRENLYLDIKNSTVKFVFSDWVINEIIEYVPHEKCYRISDGSKIQLPMALKSISLSNYFEIDSTVEITYY